MKRNKINNSDPSINLRLPKELKDKLTEEANDSDQTVSKYVRGLLSSYLNGELYEEEIREYKNNQFITSIEFVKLMTWVNGKFRYRIYKVEDEVIFAELISTLKKIGQYVPEDIATEFDKILLDILTCKGKPEYSKEYKFYRKYEGVNYFDIEKVENYIMKLKNPDRLILY